jgi:RNA polymerase sigma-70 factor, ECF subfamily
VEQIGALLQIAPRSVKRDWALARIWLFRELRPGVKDAEAERKLP